MVVVPPLAPALVPAFCGVAHRKGQAAVPAAHADAVLFDRALPGR